MKREEKGTDFSLQHLISFSILGDVFILDAPEEGFCDL